MKLVLHESNGKLQGEIFIVLVVACHFRILHDVQLFVDILVRSAIGRKLIANAGVTGTERFSGNLLRAFRRLFLGVRCRQSSRAFSLFGALSWWPSATRIARAVIL